MRSPSSARTCGLLARVAASRRWSSAFSFCSSPISSFGLRSVRACLARTCSAALSLRLAVGLARSPFALPRSPLFWPSFRGILRRRRSWSKHKCKSNEKHTEQRYPRDGKSVGSQEKQRSNCCSFHKGRLLLVVPDEGLHGWRVHLAPGWRRCWCWPLRQWR